MSNGVLFVTISYIHYYKNTSDYSVEYECYSWRVTCFRSVIFILCPSLVTSITAPDIAYAFRSLFDFTNDLLSFVPWHDDMDLNLH